MSYILDALRKSDLQRQRGVAPTLLSTHVAAETSKQQPFLLYCLLAAALVGTGVMIGVLQPWQSQQPVPAPAPPSITLETARKPAPEISVQKAVPAAQPAPVAAPANTEARRPVSKAPTGVAEKPGTRSVDVVQDRGVMSISELPPAIQQSIPRMVISVHAYSPKPQDRVVMINGRMLREGQELAPGLRLEQITPDGMSFSFGGYHFHRGLQQSGETAEMK